MDLDDAMRLFPFSIRLIDDFKNIIKPWTTRTYASTGEPIEVAYARTLRSGEPGSSDDADGVASQHSTQGYKQFVSSLIRTSKILHRMKLLKLESSDRALTWFAIQGIDLMPGKHEPMIPKNFDAECHHAITREIATSHKGHIGLVPQRTRVGDQIAVFQGKKMPWIIRRKDKDWVVIGDAYIHEMYGEAYDATKCEEIWIL